MGLICMVRHNGTAAERKTISDATSAAEERTTGSWAETQKMRLFTHRDAPQLPASPITNPIAPSLAAWFPVRREIAMVPAPLAMRMAEGI
jgi:hypothetical protein